MPEEMAFKVRKGNLPLSVKFKLISRGELLVLRALVFAKTQIGHLA